MMRLQGYAALLFITILDLGCLSRAEIVSAAFAQNVETQLQTSKVLEIVESIPRSKTIGNCSLYCRVYRSLNNVVNNLRRVDKPIIIVSGLEIVPAKYANVTENIKDNYGKDDEVTLIENFSEFLKTHVMNIKFADLFKGTSNSDNLRQIKGNQDETKLEGRKKDKSQGLLMAMSVMFAKMMALLGIGGIGLLALKALGVASSALILAGLMGLKSLAQHGTEATHSVQYVATDGNLYKRRRRRSNFYHAK